MTELYKMLGAKLNEPELVSDAELDILNTLKLWENLSKISFVIIQNLFVDIETLIIKNDSHG